MDIINFIQTSPLLGIFIISVAITIIMTGIRFFLTDRKMMREIKEKQKWIREEMKKYKHDAEKLADLNKQMMEHFPTQMKQSLKIMMVTIIPMIILIGWLRTTFEATALAGTWIWWYILFSMIVGIALGKMFKLD